MDPLIEQICSWQAGHPLSNRLDHPVVCVTRTEAQAYCASRGGRLPTIAEWLKAGRGLEPDARRFPWGDEPPKDLDPSTDPQQGWQIGRAIFGLYASAPSQPGTAAVGSDALGKSPWGALGLAGNAAEILSTCAEDVDAAYPPSGDLDAPAEPPRPTCAEAILLAGTHWRDPGTYAQAAGAASIFRFHKDARPEYLAGPHLEWAMTRWQELASLPPGTDAAGNGWRDWALGFRCVYDAE